VASAPFAPHGVQREAAAVPGRRLRERHRVIDDAPAEAAEAVQGQGRLEARGADKHHGAGITRLTSAAEEVIGVNGKLGVAVPVFIGDADVGRDLDLPSAERGDGPARRERAADGLLEGAGDGVMITIAGSTTQVAVADLARVWEGAIPQALEA
jgi:hypothetical protein